MQTLYVIPLEALGSFPDGAVVADVRDYVAALAARAAGGAGARVALLSGLPRRRQAELTAWLRSSGLDPDAVGVVYRDDAFGAAALPGWSTRWVRQALRRSHDINRIVFFSPRSEVIEEVASFVGGLPREVDFEAMHVRDGAIHRWFA